MNGVIFNQMGMNSVKQNEDGTYHVQCQGCNATGERLKWIDELEHKAGCRYGRKEL